MLPNEALSNFIYPNDAHVLWSLMIVIYPYITGLLVGAFVVSSFHHVFRIKEFESVSRFALVVALCFGLFAALPLLVHLGQPQRAFNIFFTPHLTSAMSIFGYVYSGCMLLLILELWLAYRPYFVQRAAESTGLARLTWWALMLGVPCNSSASRRVDERLVIFLSAVGIPGAFLLSGYEGFIFGSIKGNGWWASALKPVTFSLSALVSGMAMLLLMYCFTLWRRKQACNYPMLRKLAGFIWGALIINLVLDLLEVLFAAYEHGYHWAVVKPLLSGPLFDSYVVWQVLILSVIPLLLLGFAVVGNVRDRTLSVLANLSALLLVTQVLLVRFNEVVGGQMISKSGRGFTDFEFEWLAREGIVPAAVILVAPFMVYFILGKLIPILDREPPPGVQKYVP